MKKIVVEFKVNDTEYTELNDMVVDTFGLSFPDWIKNEVKSNLEYELDANVSGTVNVQVKDIE